MSQALRLLSDTEQSQIDPALRNFIEHRKSGLSLNHVVGCPLNCHYCVRLLWGNFELKTPTMLASDGDAVRALLAHPHFVPGRTPIQIFNRATDPFLPGVKPHLFNVLQDLDRRGLGNLVIVITRYRVTEEDMAILEGLRHIRVTIFFTYSGGANRQVEPLDPAVTEGSIRVAGRLGKRTGTVLYWRPLVMGWNDDDATMERVLHLAAHADAIVFSGFFYREQISNHLQVEGIEQPYPDLQRRKILPRDLERKVLRLWNDLCPQTPIFRKTTCAAAFVHGLPDPNGHWGVRDICAICPRGQQAVCAAAHQRPEGPDVQSLLDQFEYRTPFEVEDGHIWTEGLTEQQRYNLQHQLGYQVWDRSYPHLPRQHGRATLGWEEEE